MSNPLQEPGPDAQSRQPGDRFDTMPENFPDEARNIYYQAYQEFIRERGNNPELAHQTAMQAVMQSYHQNEVGEWIEQSSSK